MSQYSQPYNLEKSKISSPSVLDVVWGRNPKSQELRAETNNYGFDFKQYEHLLFGEGCADRVVDFAAELKKELEGDLTQDPAFQLASMYTCLDLSQALARVADKFDLNYPDSDLAVEDVGYLQGILRDVTHGIKSASALVEIIREKVEHIFGLYESYPMLHVDVPLRNYETDILGPKLLLNVRNTDNSIVISNSRLAQSHEDIAYEAHPTLFAKDMIGFRDVGERVCLAADISHDEIQDRIDYTSEKYFMLDRGLQDYLSGTDYELFEDHSNRRMIIDSAWPIAEIVDSTNQEQLRLLQEMHRPVPRAVIENHLGISLKDISLEDQFELLKFGTTCDRERFDRLGKVMQEFPEEDRVQMFSAFLAVEFGDDFGDILLALAESVNKSGFLEVVDHITHIRQNAQIITKKLANANELLQSSLEVAFAKRVTELLALAYQKNINSIRETTADIADALTCIAEAVYHDQFEISEANHDYGTLRAAKGPVTITIRPYGKNARIGFTVRNMGENGKQRLSIRLDYEEDGRLSLDIGSLAKETVNSSQLSQRIGQDLAAGEQAIAHMRGVEPLHGNHVREAFEPLGRLEQAEFSQIVNHFLYQLQIQEPTMPETPVKKTRQPKDW